MEVVKFMKSEVNLVGEHSISPIFLKKSSTWRNWCFAAAPIHQNEPGLTEKL